MSEIEEEIELLERAIAASKRADSHPGVITEEGVYRFGGTPIEQMQRRLLELRSRTA